MSESVEQILVNGSRQWLLPNGTLHRIDGPARISLNGYQAWWQNGKRHRSDGPAVIDPDGREVWYLHDKLHRLDGPAFIASDGTQEWFINNRDLTEIVSNWILDNDLPEWQLWDDEIKILFRLKFS